MALAVAVEVFWIVKVRVAWPQAAISVGSRE